MSAKRWNMYLNVEFAIGEKHESKLKPKAVGRPKRLQFSYLSLYPIPLNKFVSMILRNSNK